MTLNHEQAKIISKYSFVTNAVIENAELRIYYFKDGKKKYKKLPLRASSKQLLKKLGQIRTELRVSIYGKGNQSDVFII